MRALDTYTKGLIIGGLTASVLIFLYDLGLGHDINYSSQKALTTVTASLVGSLLVRVLFSRWFFRR
jgi:hypothetical protein